MRFFDCRTKQPQQKVIWYKRQSKRQNKYFRRLKSKLNINIDNKLLYVGAFSLEALIRQATGWIVISSVVTISNSVTEKESENKHILYVVWLCGYVAMWHKVPSARVYLHVLSQAKSFSVDSMFADFVFFVAAR